MQPAVSVHQLRATDGRAPAATVDISPLVETARAYLSSRNEQLVLDKGGGSAANDLAKLSATEQMSSHIADEHRELRAVRARLALLGEQYAKFETSVQVISNRVTQEELAARIEESSRIYYVKVHGDEPDFTEFRVERDFFFVRQSNGWALDHVQLANPEGVAPINEVVALPSADPTSEPDLAGSAAVYGAPTATKAGELAGGWASVINRANMVNYARTYARSYNGSFRTFSNDCTNFVSQAALAGGWGMISGWYRSDSAWWYDSSWMGIQSWTWAGAQNWKVFALNSGRTSILRSVWDMQLGDVLQLDFDRDSNINHSMIVTNRGTGDMYLSYHTTDTLDRSLNSIIAVYPSAWYYSHRM